MSAVGQFFVESYGVRMRGGYLRFQAQYLRRIRVPDPMTLLPRARQRNWSGRSAHATGNRPRGWPLKSTESDLQRWRRHLDIDKSLQEAVQSYWDARSQK